MTILSKAGAAAIFAAAAVFSSPALGADPQDLYRDGVAARHAGDQRRAIDLLGQAVAAEPANADARLQLGLAYAAAGRTRDAEAELRRTLELAPDYADARIALARLAQQRGDWAAAREALQSVDPANADPAALRQQLATTTSLTYRWQLDVDATYSAVDSGRSDWKEGTIQLRHQANARTAVAAAVETSKRFGLTDTYGELRIEHRFSDAFAAYALGGATPEADFRPRWQIGAGVSAQLRGGPGATALTLDARQARFDAGDIQTLSPGIEQYLAGGRAWVSARWINLFDERGNHRSGWLARGDVMARDSLRLFAGIADAPDVSEGIVVDTRSLFGGLSAAVSERMTLRLSVAHEDRETGADRSQFGLGMGIRF